jgi:hypothetical protein
MPEIAYVVNIPKDLVGGAVAVVAQFCGPTAHDFLFQEGDVSTQCVAVGDDEVVCHFHGEGPKGVRLWTHVEDLALLLEGYVEAQGDSSK